MFGISFSEIIVIAIATLIFIGPEKLPELAQKAGKLIRAYNNARLDLKERLNDSSKKMLNSETKKEKSESADARNE